ncbi:MAG TPA: flagellar motor protein MotB [Alphaproteobacteria bacterium]|nr:flagellar motor protein MotB [Alphaproteobacteria bacterium]
MAGNAAPIIVKKRKAKHHEGHHGGAWKVAYADFVTAMMAFFLLLWLLNSTTQEQRSGISNYFSNASVARTTSGAGGVLGGQTITLDGPQRGKGAPLGLPTPMPNKDSDSLEDEGQQDRINSGPSDFRAENPTLDGQTNNPPGPKPSGQGGKDKTEGPQPSEEDLKALMRKREEEKFKLVERAIKRTLERLPGLRKFADHLILESTEEGLRIQIIDRAKTSMFARGSSVPYQHTRQLLEVVSHAVAKLPNKVLVAGHTDATPYARGASYSNWELSADRANAARRELTRFGVPAGRFARVVGKAATQPLLADDPKNARNRRISITLLREDRPPPEVAHRQRTPVKRKATPPPPVVNGSKLQKVIPPKPEGGR